MTSPIPSPVSEIVEPYPALVKEPAEELAKEPFLPKEAEPQTIIEPEVFVVPVPPDVKPIAAPVSALEALEHVNRLLIDRHLPIKALLFLSSKKNRFYVRTPDQNLVYTVTEKNSMIPSWWVGCLFNGLRSMKLHVKNSRGVEVMTIRRPFKYTPRVLPCQLQCMQVYAPPGNFIGSVQQKWTAVKPLYLIKNAAGDAAFWIRGPCYTLSFFKDIQFQVVRPDGTSVGATCKRWEGLVHATFYSAIRERFGVAFEKELSTEEKALLLATTLLLDYMYYDI